MKQVLRIVAGFCLLFLAPLPCEAEQPSRLGQSARHEASVAVASDPGARTQRAAQAPRRRDSLWNGVIIGAAIGAASGAAYVHVFRDSDLGAGAYAYGALIFGGFGAAAGLGVDALLGRSPGPATGASPGVTLAPRVSRSATGIRGSVQW